MTKFLLPSIFLLASCCPDLARPEPTVAFLMHIADHRHLLNRDHDRAAGDRLALAVLHQLDHHADADLAAALLRYHNEDGPCWALPLGEVMITRYDWSTHRPVIVAVFADRAGAEVELARLTAAEVELRARDKENGRLISRPNFYAIVKRP